MKGYAVGFWVTDPPLTSKRVSEILGNEENARRLVKACKNGGSFVLEIDDKKYEVRELG